MEEEASAQELENIAIICKSVIEDPETHIESLSLLQKSLDYKDWNYRSVLFLSLTKVFKNIVPFYKIRTMKEKVKFGEEEGFVSGFDKKVLKEYGFFIKKVVQFDNKLTYECAAQLFSSLNHFNFSDKLIRKLLKGTKEVSTDFSEVIMKVITKDKEGEITEKITNEMIDLEFNPRILESFLEIDFPEENYKKVYENIFRIYFTVLKEGRKEFLYFTYKGLIKLKERIGKKFLEGIYLLLTGLLFKGGVSSRLECVNCILNIFGGREYDFKKILSSLFEIIIPLKYNIKTEDSILLVDLLRKMLIFRRQNEMRAVNFLHRLMQYCLVKYDKNLITLVTELYQGYQIDILDKETLVTQAYNYFEEDIDYFGEKIFTEYDLFKKMVGIKK